MSDIDHIKANFRSDIKWFKDFEKISTALAPHRNSLVVVDGHFGSGKSYLAARIAHRLLMAHVDVDTYCSGGNETYLKHIDYPGLSSAVGEGKRVVLSGILSLAVLDRLNTTRASALSASAKIYVVVIGKSVSRWRDIDYHEHNQEADWTPLENEIWEYNRCYEPADKSDHVFYRFFD